MERYNNEGRLPELLNALRERHETGGVRDQHYRDGLTALQDRLSGDYLVRAQQLLGSAGGDYLIRREPATFAQSWHRDVVEGVTSRQLLGFGAGVLESFHANAQSIANLLFDREKFVTDFLRSIPAALEFIRDRETRYREFINSDPEQQARMIGRVTGDILCGLIMRAGPGAAAGRALGEAATTVRGAAATNELGGVLSMAQAISGDRVVVEALSRTLSAAGSAASGPAGPTILAMASSSRGGDGSEGATSPPSREPTLLEQARQHGVANAIDGADRRGAIEVFVHGTTAEVAAQYIDTSGSGLNATGGNHGGKFFTVPSREVAQVFAERISGNRPGSQPAMVGIALPREVCDNLRSSGMLYREPIPNPPPGTGSGPVQWVFRPGALEILKHEGFFFPVR